MDTRLPKLKRLNKMMREAAQETGLLPHEILLKVARGQLIQHEVLNADGTVETRYLPPVNLDTIIDAAKHAAPFFAPKISTVEIIQGVSDEDLDQLIAQSAAAAGLSLGADGEGEEGEGAEGAGGGSIPRRRIRLPEGS